MIQNFDLWSDFKKFNLQDYLELSDEPQQKVKFMSVGVQKKICGPYDGPGSFSSRAIYFFVTIYDNISTHHPVGAKFGEARIEKTMF